MRPHRRRNSRKMTDAVRIRLVLLPAACALATWALAASASAATSDGAPVTNTHGCNEIIGGTFCIDDHTVSNFSSAPSGNTVIVGNTRSDVSFTSTDGACSSQTSTQETFRVVLRPELYRFSDHPG
jgi:hypothetical protein